VPSRVEGQPARCTGARRARGACLAKDRESSTLQRRNSLVSTGKEDVASLPRPHSGARRARAWRATGVGAREEMKVIGPSDLLKWYYGSMPSGRWCSCALSCETGSPGALPQQGAAENTCIIRQWCERSRVALCVLAGSHTASQHGHPPCARMGGAASLKKALGPPGTCCTPLRIVLLPQWPTSAGRLAGIPCPGGPSALPPAASPPSPSASGDAGPQSRSLPGGGGQG